MPRDTTSSGDDANPGPLRTCIGCRSIRPQRMLERWALAADGTPLRSPVAPGRGAWLCAGSVACFRQALKRRGFERAWKRPLAPDTIHDLHIACEAMMTNMEN